VIDKNIVAARQTYRERQARAAHPDGKFDRAGRWHPSAAEWRDCCSSVRSPTRAWPYSLMKHCRSAEHVAELFNVKRSEVLVPAAERG